MVSTMTMPVAADRPPMKANSASHGRCSAIGSVSTKVSASTVPLGKVQQAAERDRQHEDVDRQQVEREQPDRLVEVALVHVFHHRHLELARQEHDGGHRQEGERGPRRVVAAVAADREQRAQLGHLAGAAEDVVEAVVHPEGDEQAHRDEGEQLHHRLECDRRHQALVALGGVEVARAEQDGEGGQQHGDVEGVVAEEQRRALLVGHHHLGILKHDREGVGDRLQLQRDVGDDPDHGDDRHQAAQQLALAVARGDEVGDGGDAVLPC